MKKYLVLLLAVLMTMVAMTGAFAEEASMPADSAELSVIPSTADKEEDTTRAASRSDVVEIDGNTYAVVTGENIGIAYEAPSSSIYVLTQDYLRQADLFAKFYNDPLAAASEFVSNGTHLNIYDSVNNVDIYVRIATQDWASLYPDAAELTDAEITRLDEYFCRNGFDTASTSTFGYAGGNPYFFYNCLESDGAVFMFTSVGGYQVSVLYQVQSMDQVVTGLELLEGLTIVAM